LKNITLPIDEETLNAGREYARRHNLSLNSLVCRLLKQSVMKSSALWITESFQIMDKAKASSQGKKWRREDLYRV